MTTNLVQQAYDTIQRANPNGTDSAATLEHTQTLALTRQPRTTTRPEGHWRFDHIVRAEVCGDCEVIIRVANGQWAARQRGLTGTLTCRLIRTSTQVFNGISCDTTAPTEPPFRHVFREANARADTLANAGRQGRRQRTVSAPVWQRYMQARAQGDSHHLRVWFDGSVANSATGVGCWLEVTPPHAPNDWTPLALMCAPDDEGLAPVQVEARAALAALDLLRSTTTGALPDWASMN